MQKPMEEVLADLEKLPLRKFQPFAWYNPDGDDLEIYWQPGADLAEWVDALFTVLVNPEDREQVGGLVIKNVRRHFGESGLQAVLVKTGRASVRMLVSAAIFGEELAHFHLERSTDKPRGARARIANLLLGSLGDAEVELRNFDAA